MLFITLGSGPGCSDGDGAFPDTTPVVDAALRQLAEGDLAGANDGFAQAAAANPSDDRANLFYAMTHIAVSTLEDPRIRGMISRSNGTVEGSLRDVCAFRVRLPDEIAAGTPRSSEIIDVLESLRLTELEIALAHLRRVAPEVNIAFARRHLPSCWRSGEVRVEVIEIDRADVAGLEALIESTGALLDTLSAYHLDVDVRDIENLSPQNLLAKEPDLLNLRSADALGRARSAWDRALAAAAQALALMQRESDEQSDDVLVISPENHPEADRWRIILGGVRESLRGPSVIPVDIRTGEFVESGGTRLDLSRLFSGHFASLRVFLPAFDEDGNFDCHSLPDPTFGGTLPDLTREDLDEICNRLNGFAD